MSTDAAISHYRERHQALAGQFAGQGLEWLAHQRQAGLDRFHQLGFPSTRDEDWRYTAPKPITGTLFEPAIDAGSLDTSDLEALRVEGLESDRLVFVDGVFSSALSTTGENTPVSWVGPLSRALEECPARIEALLGGVSAEPAHGFTALNNAFTQDGAVVCLEDGCQPDSPLELLFVSQSEGSLAQPRNIVALGRNARVSIIERHVSLGSHRALTNSATEVVLAEGAEADYYLVQTQAAPAMHVSGTWARQAAGSRFSCRTITLGGALVRNELRTELDGEGAHCDMFGLYSLSGRQHVDNHTTLVHNAVNCTSNELYRGVLDQRSRAVFHGRIKVAQGAVGTDAEQANNNLLLSRDAEIDTKPQLEIYADDVKCAHGATVGQIDDNALFYLRSRGIDADEARTLLTFAFVNDVVARIDVEPLRTHLERLLAEQLVGEAART